MGCTLKHFITCFILIIFQPNCSGNIVQSNVGPIVGVNSDEYTSYLGIPYGKVDARNYFGKAEPYPVGSGDYYINATTTADECAQLNANGDFTGYLDCLYLNVYTPPSTTATSRLPVIVFIHGGSFKSGSGNAALYGPKFIVRHNVILVTINYRLGPYGFMCIDHVDVTGNQGLKDQHFALQWVKNNIEAFGGNPDEITLAGQSAGGHSVDFHLHTQRERLFNKVIIQSGSSLATTVLHSVEKEAPLKIAEHLGFQTTSHADALSRLSQTNPELVLRAARDLGLDFKPCAERPVSGVDPFLTHDWTSSLTPNVEGIPVLIGFTQHEMMGTHLNKGAEHFTSNFISNHLNETFSFDDERGQRMETFVRRFYMGDQQIGPESVWPVINFDSDFTYIHPIQRSIRKYLESNAKDIYYYMFSYSGGRNWGKITDNVSDHGAAHADDLGYLFDISQFTEPISAQDQLIIDRMTTMWTNFAKYGDPTPDTTATLPVKWIPLTNETYNYLRIDTDLKLERRPFHKRMAFLDLLYKYNKDYMRSFAYVEADNDDGNNAVLTSASVVSVLVPVMILLGLM